MYDREHREYLRKIKLNKFLVHLVQLLIIIVFIFLWNRGSILFETWNCDLLSEGCLSGIVFLFFGYFLDRGNCRWKE